MHYPTMNTMSCVTSRLHIMILVVLLLVLQEDHAVQSFMFQRSSTTIRRRRRRRICTCPKETVYPSCKGGTNLFSSFHPRSSGAFHFHNDKENDDSEDPRRPEFDILQDEPTLSQEQKNVRKLRLQREEDIQNSFVPYGNELWTLRQEICKLSEKLIEDLSTKGGYESRSIRAKLRELEARDANVVYGLELDRMDEAIDGKRFQDAEKHREMARKARSHLAQFNLEGLWVGKYGDHGFEMINVTYVGDTLIARKVTGDQNVPAGEITFQVDLSPTTRHTTTSLGSKELPNIVLSEEAAKRWENKELQRFHGLGHVAEEGFQNSQWLEGQMVLISKEYFSFAWLPLSQQIFFGRPSPELSLTMIQDSLKKPVLDRHSDPNHDAVDANSVKHISRCFESTVDALEDGSLEDPSDSCIFLDDDNMLCFE